MRSCSVSGGRPSAVVACVQVVLKQPGFSQSGTDGELVFAIERARSKQGDQVGGGVGTPAALQRGIRAGECWVKCRGRHGREYTKYTSRWKL